MQTPFPELHADHGKPWYRQPWPWLLMLGPALVIVAGIHTTWLAFSGQDALVVDDYYKQGKAINQDLRRDRAAARLGLRLQMHYDAAAGKISGHLAGSAAYPAGAVRVRLIHSTLPDRDITLDARVDGDGRFEIPLPILDRARWQVLVESAEGEWRLAGTWQWPLQRNVALAAQAS